MALVTKQDLPFVAYSGVTLALRAIPWRWRLRWMLPVSRVLGRLWYRLDRSNAALGRRNMHSTLGDRYSAERLEAELLRHFQVIAFGKIFNDILPELDLAHLNHILYLDGKEHVDAAMAQNRGALLFGTHYGLHGYVPLTLFQRHGYPFQTVVGAELSDGDSWIYRKLVHPIRSRNWDLMPIINPTGNPQREMVKALEDKDALLIWPDFVNDELFRLPEPHTLSVPFLGRMMRFRTGAFRLARWMKVPVLPFTVLPDGDRFVMKVEAPLVLSAETNPLEALRADVAAFARYFEPHVLAHPGMWWQWRQERFDELLTAEPQTVAAP